MRSAAPIIAGAILIGAALGFFLRGGCGTNDTPKPAIAEHDEVADENQRLREELRRLEEERAGDLDRLDELTRLLEEAPASAAAAAVTAAPATAGGPATLPPRRLPYTLASVDEADAIYDEAVERTDFEALWKLGAVLLGMGEPGYEKLIALLSRFNQDMENSESARRWMNSEMLAGRFLRDFAAHHEEFLRFSLYVNSRDPQSLPEPLRELRRELQGELGGILLGFHDGGDPEIDAGFLRMYEDVLREEAAAKPHEVRRAVRALAQLRGDAATDLLIEVAARVPIENLADVVLALGFQGNPRAVPALQALRENVDNPKVIEAIDAALNRFR